MKIKNTVRQRLLSLAPVLGILCLSTASAQSNWAGTTSTDWTNPDNWSSGVPTPTVTAVINNSGTIVIGDGIVAETLNLDIGSATSTAGTVHVLAGGTLNATGFIRLGAAATNNYMVINGGVVDSLSYIHVAYSGSSVLDILNGGQLYNRSGVSVIGRTANPTHGTINVSGEGSLWSFYQIQLSYNGTGVLNVSDYGRVETSSTMPIIFSTNGAGNGMANISTFGEWVAPDNDFSIGDSGTGSLTVDSGGFVIGANMTLGGRVGGNAASKGTITLFGNDSARGVVEANAILKGIASGTLSFDGGILRARQNNANFVSGVTVTAEGEGAFIDSNGFDIGIGVSISGAGGLTKLGEGNLILNNPLTYTGTTAIQGGVLTLTAAHQIATSAGVSIATGGTLLANSSQTLSNISGEGLVDMGANSVTFHGTDRTTFAGAITANGITKTGADNTILTGNLGGVTGPIAINEGGLFTGDFTGNITAASDAAFGGAGVVTGNVSFLGDGILQAGFTHNDVTVTVPSTLTISGAVDFADDATLRYDMFNSGIDTIVAGSVTFGSLTNTVDITNVLSGTFTIFKLTGGTFDSSILTGITTTQDGGDMLNDRIEAVYSLANSNTELQLVSIKTNHVVKWTGAVDDVWNISTSNWGGGDTEFLGGDKVIFDATGGHTIDIMSAGAVVSEIYFNGNGSYTFTGGRITVDTSSLGTLGDSFGGVTPTGAFTINSTGTVTLANNEANIFPNGINVQQGTLVGTVTTLGDSNILNNGKTVFHQADEATYTGIMTGNGTLVKTGVGNLHVGNNLSGFTGKTDIQQGILEIAEGATYGSSLIIGSNDSTLRIRANAVVTGSAVLDNSRVFLGEGSRLGNASITNGDIQTVDNSEITGNLTLGTSSTLHGSGTFTAANINISGNVTISHIDPVRDYGIIGVITGSGELAKTGVGTVVINTPSSYSGATNVADGTLAANAEGAFSPNSDFTVSPGATLDLRGYNQTLSSLANNGSIWLSPAGAVGAKLRVVGPYASNLGTINIGITAGDNTKTISDQLVFANAAAISGTTKIRVQFTDSRSDSGAVIYDMDPIIITEAGMLDPATFVLDDGRGYTRVLLGDRDYILQKIDDSLSLVATTAAEMPAALAANAISIMAGRAAFGSINQRLDYLRSADTLLGSDSTGLQAWAQTYYRADELDGKLFPGSDGTVWGIQVGIDGRTDQVDNAYTTYGAFVDRTEGSADLPNRTSADTTSTGFGGYVSFRTLGNWHVDAALRYSRNSYEIKVGHQSMDTKGYSWGAMLRAAKVNDIGKNWTLTPQAQLTYQNTKIYNTDDNYGRDYEFGPGAHRINHPSSFESRLGAGLRKTVAINDRISIAPYVSAQFLYEFKGDLSVLSVNNTSVREDFGGESFLFTVGIPVRLGRRVDAYVDGSMQTGGSITGYGLNFGINYRW